MGWGGGEGRGGDAYLPLINHDFKINIIKFGVRVYTYLDYLLGGGGAVAGGNWGWSWDKRG